jgi:hypothetical protein
MCQVAPQIFRKKRQLKLDAGFQASRCQFLAGPGILRKHCWNQAATAVGADGKSQVQVMQQFQTRTVHGIMVENAFRPQVAGEVFQLCWIHGHHAGNGSGRHCKILQNPRPWRHRTPFQDLQQRLFSLFHAMAGQI